MKSLVCGLILFLVGCNQFSQHVASSNVEVSSQNESAKCAYNYDSAGRIISWRHSWPIKFYFDQSVPAEYEQAIRDSVKVWSSSDLKPLIEFAEQKVSSEKPASDGKNVIYWVTKPDSFNLGEQGRTVTRWKNGQLIDSDISINAKDFTYFIDKATMNYELHLQSLLIHEFGHALGIKHISIFSSVMYMNLAYLQIRDVLSEEDHATLRCQYP